MTEPINLTVVIDEDSDECLYIEGKSWRGTGESTVYVTDLTEAAGNRPIMLRHVHIEHTFTRWPDKLEDALKPAEASS